MYATTLYSPWQHFTTKHVYAYCIYSKGRADTIASVSVIVHMFSTFLAHSKTIRLLSGVRTLNNSLDVC